MYFSTIYAPVLYATLKGYILYYSLKIIYCNIFHC